MRPHDAVGCTRTVTVDRRGSALRRTGTLDRQASPRLRGVALPLVRTEGTGSASPALRSHLQSGRTGFDNRDAKILSIGIGANRFGPRARAGRGRRSSCVPAATPVKWPNPIARRRCARQG
jgi:hypothetical protein